MRPPITQNKKEFNELLGIYSLWKPQRVLEIGTHHGGTLYYWLKYAIRGSVIGSIDLQGIVTHENASEWSSPQVTTLLFKGDSTSEEAIIWVTDNLGQLDWLFIDGGHDYETVKKDWENYSPLVRKGGLVAFHDICPHEPYNNEPIEVDRLWSEIKNNYAGVQEIIEPHDEWGFGPGIGVVYL